MKSGKHILLITPGFPASEEDDSCIPALQVFVKNFHEQYPAYSISVVTLHYPFTAENYLWNGIPVFPCNGRNKKGLARLQTIRKAKSSFELINARQKIDFIHSFWLGECTVLGKKLALKNKIPHACTLMGQDVRESNRFLNKSFLKDVPVIALSGFHSEQFEKNSGRKVTDIIPWGIENAEEVSGLKRDIDFLAAGSLIELKRYDLFIQTIAELKKDFPEIRAIIAGDGPERKNLENFAVLLGVQKNIHFAGQVSRKEVLELMKQSKVFLHPSSFESYGFVFAEARRAGMAIVSFAVGIAKESDEWEVVETNEQFFQATTKMLRLKTSFLSAVVFPVESTSELYNKIYSGILP
jgi:glycosyltransferase involved in cell wall biosynthesis